MGWTEAAKRVWRVQSKALNAPTHWFTPCCLRAKRSSANVVGSVIQEGEADQSAAVTVGGADPRRKSVRMERRFWNGSRRKPAGDSSKSRKRSLLIKPPPPFRNSSATTPPPLSSPT